VAYQKHSADSSHDEDNHADEAEEHIHACHPCTVRGPRVLTLGKPNPGIAKGPDQPCLAPIRAPP
jgi:hypothetical protein